MTTRLSDIPGSWGELRHRLTYLLGGGEQGAAECQEWVREALSASWGARHGESDLSPRLRDVALKRAAGVLLLLEWEHGDLLPFETHARVTVQRAFARYFGGIELRGPEWRVSHEETDRPTWTEWSAQHTDSFEEVNSDGAQ